MKETVKKKGLCRIATYIVIKISGWGQIIVDFRGFCYPRDSILIIINTKFIRYEKNGLFNVYLTAVNLCKMVPFNLKSYTSTVSTVFILFVNSFECVDMNFKFKKSISANSTQLRSRLELLGNPLSLKKPALGI